MPVFDARQAVDDAADDYPPFPFIGLDGETYEIPHALTITERQAAKLNAGGVAVVVKELAPDAWAAIEDMPVHVSRQIGEQWASQAGEPGKSRPGSTRTRNNVKPSKRTSQPAE